MSGDASEVSRNCASHYEARQQFLRDGEDEFHRRQEDWQRINQLERALDASTRRVDELCAENERLRGLVRYAYECAIHSDHATCEDCRWMNSGCILADRMHELGIEVDGA